MRQAVEFRQNFTNGQKMRKAELYRYAIPCQTGVVLRKQPLIQREGLILKLEENGKIGLGEIAPLPGFSQETLADAEMQAKMWLANQTDDLEELFPSVAFGISCALAELRNELITQGKFASAILCDGNFTQFAQKIARIPQPLGKIKIGFEPEKEGELANRLLEQFPHLTLRLDANRSFSLAQAVGFGKKIAKSNRLRIQFIEEPCFTPSFSRQFAQATGIAIAWDESVREAGFNVKAEDYLKAIVIKPTLTGSLAKCVNLIKQAHTQGLKAVISSSLESSLGLSQLARIAAQYTPETVAGLDTLGLMQVQLVRAWQGSDLPLAGLQSRFLQKIAEI
ncbi:o-succinylbenzoate synthase [Actinobacillus pleuropneumoniae]|uniref:o-succinylbenzoate synthase n=1 Tax=Actinobacillus pleuropneumoniae TaxID=715 RepID=UPI003D076D3C